MKQSQALDILKTGANVFLTGEPGAGKTHVINEYTSYLRKNGILHSVTASTGIAATHINGRTIHSWSGIGIASKLDAYVIDKIASNQHVVKRVKTAKVLIIDEVSMLGPEVLSMIEAVLREIKKRPEPFGGIQIVLVGDFFQLPPIKRRMSEREAQEELFETKPQNFAFDSPAWERLRPIVCYLTEQHRQDDKDFLDFLKAIRSDSVNEKHISNVESRKISREEMPDEAPKLYTHNVDVDSVNNKMLAQLKGGIESFTMSTTGPKGLVESLKKGCLSSENLHLKKGASVMFIKNNSIQGYVNGTLGVVEDFSRPGGHPIVRTRDGEKIIASPMEWMLKDNDQVLATIEQVPLRLAWAITVHKSQGMSLDEATMDLSRVFEYGQGYVALSRVRKFSGIHLLGYNQKAFKMRPEILEKDKDFQLESETVSEVFSKLSKKELKKMQKNFVNASGGSL